MHANVGEWVFLIKVAQVYLRNNANVGKNFCLTLCKTNLT